MTRLNRLLKLQLWSVMVPGRGRRGSAAKELGPRFDELMQAVQQSVGSGSTVSQMQSALAALQARVDTLTSDFAQLASQCKSRQ